MSKEPLSAAGYGAAEVAPGFARYQGYREFVERERAGSRLPLTKHTPHGIFFLTADPNWYNEIMPRISEFFGIIIRMFYNDHSPPHFHAEYGEFEAIYTIETIEVLRGELPRRAHAMVLEWTALNRFELKENWELAREGLPLKMVAPLE